MTPQSGERSEAFAALYERYYGWAYAYFLRKGFGEAQAREFTQEVFLRVYTHGMHEEPEDRWMPWLITVVQNMAISEYRRNETRVRHREKAAQWVGRGAEMRPSPDEAAASGEAVRALRTEIGKMPAMMRKCFVLKYYHGLSYEEMADYLALSVNTIRTHLKRGMKQLRLNLEVEPVPEGG